MQLRTKFIAAAIAAALPLLALTGASTATAATAARPAFGATARPFTATAAAIPNNRCWKVVAADRGAGPYMEDAGLHNPTTIGNYNACFYLSANGSSYAGFPGYEMQINPAGRDCEKVVYPDTFNADLVDEPCDDQHNGDTLETWLVFTSGLGGYYLANVGDDVTTAQVNSLANGTVVYEGGGFGTFARWGLEPA